jgi:cytochrome c-type biogenesis protein CcmH/NrfG
LREAAQKSPSDKYVWYHLGNVYSKLAKTNQALRDYREAIKIDKGLLKPIMT